MTTTPSAGLSLETIAELDPVLWEAMLGERRRQHDKIELIASENYVSAAVMEAQGSWLTNKYAEGLPGKRYYGGCEFVDVAERLAQERALALFPGSEHVNVQPHSGAQANMAAYFSVIQPGDRILGMNLAHGGHLTHGMALNFSGRLYEVHAYGVRQDTERIDYDAMETQAQEVRPKLIVGGASAYSRTWDFERMAAIARSVGALLFVDMAHVAGLVAAGVHPSPFPHADLVTTTTHKTLRGPRGGCCSAVAICRRPRSGRLPRRQGRRRGRRAGRVGRPQRVPGHAGWPPDARHCRQGRRVQAGRGRGLPEDQRRTVENARVMAETLAELGARVVSGGTDNHLMLVDVTPLGVTGKEAEHLLDEIGITVNKNAIPFDTLPPNTASGIRIGTPADDVAWLWPRRDAGRGPDDHRGDPATATTPPSRPASPATFVRWCPTFRSRACPPRDPSFRGSAPRSGRSSPSSWRPPRSRSSSPRSSGVPAPAPDRGSPGGTAGQRETRATERWPGGGRVVPGGGRWVPDRERIRRPDRGPAILHPLGVAALLLGGAIAAALGALDDRFDLRARWQFLGQIALARARSCWASRSTSSTTPLARDHHVPASRSPSGSRSSGSSA